MMPKVLTVASTLTCAHQGKIALKASQQTLKIDGKAVLVLGDLNGATIAGCLTPLSTPPAPTTKPCQTVVSMASGASTNLKVGGKAVLLDTASGMTDGVTTPPSNTWSVQAAGQTKLDAS